MTAVSNHVIADASPYQGVGWPGLSSRAVYGSPVRDINHDCKAVTVGAL
jgi:hypothetical protein